MTNATELPAVFCDRADLGALMGPGDSVQMLFMSPTASAGAAGSIPAFRVAMTRLAFVEFLDALNAFRTEIAKLEKEALTRSN